MSSGTEPVIISTSVGATSMLSTALSSLLPALIPGPRITIGHGDQRLAMPRPLPIRPKSMINPIDRMNSPLKDNTPPDNSDAQQ